MTRCTIIVVARVASLTQVTDAADFWNPTGCRRSHTASGGMNRLATSSRSTPHFTPTLRRYMVANVEY
jgi:hypothetical protein